MYLLYIKKGLVKIWNYKNNIVSNMKTLISFKFDIFKRSLLRKLVDVFWNKIPFFFLFKCRDEYLIVYINCDVTWKILRHFVLKFSFFFSSSSSSPSSLFYTSHVIFTIRLLSTIYILKMNSYLLIFIFISIYNLLLFFFHFYMHF